MFLEKDNREPRVAWYEDLAREVKSWKNEGDSLIIMGDWNEDVRSNLFKLWKEDLQLINCNLQALNDEKHAPATYNRGSVPIDSILCTTGVEITRAGYLNFGEGIGDHRPVYIDVQLTSVLGIKIPPIKKAQARRLKLDDPRVIKKYNNELEKYLRSHRVKERSDLLQEFVNKGGDIKIVGEEFEEIDNIRIKGM